MRRQRLAAMAALSTLVVTMFGAVPSGHADPAGSGQVVCLLGRADVQFTPGVTIFPQDIKYETNTPGTLTGCTGVIDGQSFVNLTGTFTDRARGMLSCVASTGVQGRFTLTLIVNGQQKTIAGDYMGMNVTFFGAYTYTGAPNSSGQVSAVVSAQPSNGFCLPDPPVPGGPTTDAAVQYSAITITSE